LIYTKFGKKALSK